MKNIHVMIPDDVCGDFQREVLMRVATGNFDKDSYADTLVALTALALEKGDNVITLKSREQAEKGE